MNLYQDYTLTKVVAGALRAAADSLELRADRIQSRAAAYEMTTTDARAIQKLRQIATANGCEPAWAEACYRNHVEHGDDAQLAFDKVVVELGAA
jgi:hypothetical protein